MWDSSLLCRGKDQEAHWGGVGSECFFDGGWSGVVGVRQRGFPSSP